MEDFDLADDLAAIRRMNASFTPNPQNVIDATFNRKPARLPLYEHGIDPRHMDLILGEDVYANLEKGQDMAHFTEYYRSFIKFYRFMGYDFANMDQNIGSYMPGSGALLSEREGAITDKESFRSYPWDTVPGIFKERTYPHYEAFLNLVPGDMTAVGGAGNGIFECVQDITGFTNLCYIRSDAPELYADIFKKQAEINLRIWREFLRNFADGYGVFRFGDDLGYKSNTMLSREDINELIIPGYAPIVEEIHSYGKPMLYHSCGCIFGVMDEIIAKAGIDAKHSNESAIADIGKWVELYNDRIGIFGGIDVNDLCRFGPDELEEEVRRIFEIANGANGFAFGSGNSIAHYVPVEKYVRMIRLFRELRGEKQEG